MGQKFFLMRSWHKNSWNESFSLKNFHLIFDLFICGYVHDEMQTLNSSKLNITYVIDKLSEIYGLSNSDIIYQTSLNANDVFDFNN